MQRYVLQTNPDEFQRIFKIRATKDSALQPTFNAAPGHVLPIITTDKSSIKLTKAVWDADTPHISINEILSSPFDKLSASPCIVPISGFYIWKQSNNNALPFYVRIHTQPLLGIAGFVFQKDNFRDQFMVLTKSASVLIKPITNSMPAILKASKLNDWLLGSTEIIIKNDFQRTDLNPDMTVFMVPVLVNDLSNNGPELLQAIPKLREES